MNEQRLLTEIATLQDRFTVRFNLENGVVDLERVVYPPGWTPRRATIRYAVPDDYAASPPTVHIPADMAYQGEQPRRMKDSRFDDFTRWCVRFEWNPQVHDLVSVTRVMMNHSLPDPSKRQIAMP